MTPRRSILIGALVALITLAIALVLRDGAPSSPSTRRAARLATSGALDCRAIWNQGIELKGTVGDRDSQAFFDTRSAPNTPPQVSGIVVFPSERNRGSLADSLIGLKGPRSGDDCDVQLTEADGGADSSVWELRLESPALVKGTRRMAGGHTEAILFNVVPETRCDGAGEWRTFTSPQWPITFDYPAHWVLTVDEDDVNVECPSVSSLATGGSWLTFERGRLPPAGDDEPYWFIRRANDEWRVATTDCAGATNHNAPLGCPPARRSERNGMTMLQGAAGEHRLHRPGLGYLGEGPGITRYLFVFGDEWVSLDSAGLSAHHGDIGDHGGPVLLDGDALGDRVVRSVRHR